MSYIGGKYVGPNNSNMKWYDWILMSALLISIILGFFGHFWFFLAAPIFIISTPLISWIEYRSAKNKEEKQ